MGKNSFLEEIEHTNHFIWEDYPKDESLRKIFKLKISELNAENRNENIKSFRGKCRVRF